MGYRVTSNRCMTKQRSDLRSVMTTVYCADTVCVCMCVHVFMCVHVCAVCSCVQCVHVCMCVCMYVCMCVSHVHTFINNDIMGISF